MPTFDRPILRHVPLRACCRRSGGAAAFAPAYAQPAAIDPVVKAPPQLTSLVDSLVTVTVGRLDPGQTVTQSFTPNPVPARGRDVVNGEWPVAVVGGGEGQVNRKIRAVLRSPGGQIVADGCGYARDAKPTTAGSTTRAGAVGSRASSRAAARTRRAPGTSPSATAMVRAPPPSGPSRVLGDIKIHVSYRAAR